MKKQKLIKIFMPIITVVMISALLIVPISADVWYDYDSSTNTMSNITFDPLSGTRYYPSTLVTLVTGEQVDLAGYYEYVITGGFWVELDPGAVFLTGPTNAPFITYVKINDNYYPDYVISSGDDDDYVLTVAYTEIRVEFDPDVDSVVFIGWTYPWGELNSTSAVASRWMNQNGFDYTYPTQFDVYKIERETDGAVVGSVGNVWTNIMTWITTALGSVQSVFYQDGSLTFIGTLSVVGVSIALGFLMIGVVSRFLQLRG